VAAVIADPPTIAPAKTAKACHAVQADESPSTAQQERKEARARQGQAAFAARPKPRP